jgi:hypothetical protein
MARKKVKKVTVKELQSYIQGAIEFNEDNWCPDKAQWDKIVEMIMNIKEEKVEVRTEVAAPPPPAMPANTNHPEHEIRPVRAQQGSLSQTEVAPAPDRPSAPPTDMRRLQVEKTGAVRKDESSGVVSSGIKVKTPHLSEGDYASPFE